MCFIASELTAETIIEPSSAYQKLATEKPWIKVPANQNNEALMTKVNSPKVRILIGKVRIKIIGLTNRLSSPIVIEAIRAG